MVIDENNYYVGNKAMASVLLLYYHLIREGGFTHDQTVYIDCDDFNGFKFLDTKVTEEAGYTLDIDDKLIREGAVIYLLCELNDMCAEYDTDFLHQEFTKKVISSLTNRKNKDIPEASDIVALISVGEKLFNYAEYAAKLDSIYKKYVFEKFKSFLS